MSNRIKIKKRSSKVSMHDPILKRDYMGKIWKGSNRPKLIKKEATK